VFKVPDEIFLEIISDLPVIPLLHILSNPRTIQREYILRFEVLRALTQTCRALRAKFLSWLWERVEACVLYNQDAWYAQVGRLLEKRSLLLLRNTNLAEHVQVFTVSLTRFQTDTVLPIFAKCLASLPNLHTLEVVHAHSQMTTALKNAFSSYSYPSIRKIILPTCAHNILRSCPGVRDVTCNEDDGGKLITAIIASCPKVERIARIYKESMMLRLAKAIPNLNEIQLVRSLPGGITQLKIFKQLSVIDIVCMHDFESMQLSGEKEAIEVLKNSGSGKRKIVRMRHYSLSDGTPYDPYDRCYTELKLKEIQV